MRHHACVLDREAFAQFCQEAESKTVIKSAMDDIPSVYVPYLCRPEEGAREGEGVEGEGPLRRTCRTCRAAVEHPAMMCSKCMAVVYCNKACQAKDWKAAHKRLCRDLATLYSAPGSDDGVSNEGKNKDDKTHGTGRCVIQCGCAWHRSRA